MLSTTQLIFKPTLSNSCLANSFSYGLSKIKIDLAGSGKYPWSSPCSINRHSCATLLLADPSNAASSVYKEDRIVVSSYLGYSVRGTRVILHRAI